MTADAEPQHADDRRPVYLIMEVWAEGASQSGSDAGLGRASTGAPPGPAPLTGAASPPRPASPARSD
jgi:hypothetical protein